jgi:8-oxo-dGTP pyrophosphatase MutT (NUDIX family)
MIVVNDDQELLLVKTDRRGWEIPGGQVEQGERPRAAAIREVEEESGITAQVDAFCGIFQNTSKSICNMLFAGRAIAGDLRTSDETAAVGWFKLTAALDKITHPTFRERVELGLDPSQWPFLIEF